jgi:hypothetical protein
MSLHLEDLDPKTRDFMLDEFERDRLEGNVHLSPWLTDLGRVHYADLLALALRCGTDESLASFVKGLLLETYNERRVPCNAHRVLSESEFNRYYIRGLCRRALEERVPHLEIVRAKDVYLPRALSEKRLGALVEPGCLLLDLRSHIGAPPVHGVPLWGSGLSVRIPKAAVAEEPHGALDLG